MADGNVTPDRAATPPAWQHSTEWQAWRADNYTAAGPELNDAGRVAVAADRAHLATQIEALPVMRQYRFPPNPPGFHYIDLGEYRTAVLALLRGYEEDLER